MRDFGVVHDSYAVHGCNVDNLHIALREEFIKIYDSDVSKKGIDLFKSFILGQNEKAKNLVFPDPPKQGVLDLQNARHSKYFFC